MCVCVCERERERERETAMKVKCFINSHRIPQDTRSTETSLERGCFS